MAADLPSSYQPLPSGFDLGSAVSGKVCAEFCLTLISRKQDYFLLGFVSPF